MKLGKPYTEPNFPSWALSYLFNGDASCFDHNPETAEQDQKLVDEWAKENPGTYATEYEESESHFSWRPAFGLASDCVELTIYPWEEA